MPCRCPICMDDVSFSSVVIASRPLSVTPCGHLYHENCITQWFTKTSGEAKKQCPLCRRPCTIAKLVRLFADFYAPEPGSGQLDSQAVDTARQELADKLADLQVKYQKASESERQSNESLVSSMQKFNTLEKKLKKAERDASTTKATLSSVTAERDKALYSVRVYRKEAEELLAEQGRLKEEARQARKAATFFSGDEQAVAHMLEADDGCDRETLKILLMQAKRNMDVAVAESQMLSRNNQILTKQINDARELGLEKQRAVTSLEHLLNRERADSAKLKAKLEVLLAQANQGSHADSKTLLRSSSQDDLTKSPTTADANFDAASADNDTYRARMKALIKSTENDIPTPDDVKVHPAMQRLRQEFPPPRISLDSSMPVEADEQEIVADAPSRNSHATATLMRLPALNKTRQTSMISHIKPTGSTSGIHGGISKPKPVIVGGGKIVKSVGRNANLHEMLYNKSTSSSNALKSMQNAVDDGREKLRRLRSNFDAGRADNGDDDNFGVDNNNAGIVARMHFDSTKNPRPLQTIKSTSSSSGQRFHPAMFGLPKPITRIPAVDSAPFVQQPTRNLKTHQNNDVEVIVID